MVEHVVAKVLGVATTLLGYSPLANVLMAFSGRSSLFQCVSIVLVEETFGIVLVE